MNNLTAPQWLILGEFRARNPLYDKNKLGFSIFLGYVPMADTPA
jgi:hypothetical protein